MNEFKHDLDVQPTICFIEINLPEKENKNVVSAIETKTYATHFGEYSQIKISSLKIPEFVGQKKKKKSALHPKDEFSE